MADGNATESRLRRLEDDSRDRESRLRIVELTLARFPDLESDIKETRRDCGAIRSWVTQQIKEQREAEREKERLSLGWWAAIIGGVAVFLSSVVTAISTLAG